MRVRESQHSTFRRPITLAFRENATGIWTHRRTRQAMNATGANAETKRTPTGNGRESDLPLLSYNIYSSYPVYPIYHFYPVYPIYIIYPIYPLLAYLYLY